MTEKKNVQTDTGGDDKRPGDLPPDPALPVHDEGTEHEAGTKEPEQSRTRNPFTNAFWESGHEPGDEIMPHLKWFAILTAILVCAIIFGIVMGY